MKQYHIFGIKNFHFSIFNQWNIAISDKLFNIIGFNIFRNGIEIGFMNFWFNFSYEQGEK